MSEVNETYGILEEVSMALLNDGKAVRVKAEGFSMFPFIKPGSMILLGPVNEAISLIPGEIVAWKKEPGFVLHRLVCIRRNNDTNLYITRGDSCDLEDKPLMREQIVGKVLKIEEKSGKSRKGEEIIRKPNYFYNRLRLWIFFKFKGIKAHFHKILRSDENQV
jgi:signal peptidase I